MRRRLWITFNVLAWALMLWWAVLEPVDVVEVPLQGAFPCSR
mgnify:CR=1 FL=1